ncbi:DUF2330 domain-containing protein [Mycobacterium sp. ITM-2016-00316]|uniref:DUF2330 domain-containing protein n=1 Tax=Mycobacterium sp. ITM-2016-00316 TaxID=2099695 RepID=UPI000CFA0D00|nr:DUF2330 domain-containing protein [Mycobacterium sp. ITM-2016-00316]WNG84426.1 DUF2330 domain-containing protein [Mycobacterium sp. ITM-2016-00316]
MSAVIRAFGAVLALLLTGAVMSLAAPAGACGCGAYIPDRAGATVVDERALIAWDGSTEDILMSFGVSGSSERAAWVMPVPSAARVTLGDNAVFDDLAALTAPRIEYRDSWWPTFTWLTHGSAGAPEGVGGRPPGGVSVLATQRIGPFEVTRLAGDSTAALAAWLGDHGFPRPATLDDNLAPYVERGWEIVAIQLAPGGSGALAGTLQPLRLSFASDTVVYPMLLSRAATVPQSVELSVLAQHRMDPSTVPVAGTEPRLLYAGRLDEQTAPDALAPYLAAGTFLTSWTDVIGRPARIEHDYVFTRADSDTTYQQVIYRTREHGDLTGALLILAVVATATFLVLRLVRQAR